MRSRLSDISVAPTQYNTEHVVCSLRCCFLFFKNFSWTWRSIIMYDKKKLEGKNAVKFPLNNRLDKQSGSLIAHRKEKKIVSTVSLYRIHVYFSKNSISYTLYVNELGLFLCHSIQPVNVRFFALSCILTVLVIEVRASTIFMLIRGRSFNWLYPEATVTFLVEDVSLAFDVIKCFTLLFISWLFLQNHNSVLMLYNFQHNCG